MTPSESGRSVGAALRLVTLGTALSQVGIFAVLVILGQRFTTTPTLWLALPIVLGLADVVLVPNVGSTIRPLPLSAREPDARRIAVNTLRTVTMLRLALADAPALFGLVASIVTGSLTPFAIGAAFAVPMLLLFAYPSERVVDGVRQRLEAGGVTSYLSEELGSRSG